MSSFAELKAKLSAAWSSAPWERAEYLLAPAHDLLVERLEPRSGETLLDIATGTGAVTRRAAALGARVTGIDFAPSLIESARRLAEEEDLDVRFDLGDAEALPYEDACFDAVASSMGMIFAPDHGAVAEEVARVCRRGGRLGFTAWRPGTGFSPVTSGFYPPPEPGVGEPDDWGREEYVQSLLGDSFDLEISEHRLDFTGESGEALWAVLTQSVGPLKRVAESDRADELHRKLVDYLEEFRADGVIRVPGLYLLVLGKRR